MSIDEDAVAQHPIRAAKSLIGADLCSRYAAEREKGEHERAQGAKPGFVYHAMSVALQMRAGKSESQMNTSQRTMSIAAVSLALATMLGAFGTHALQPVLTERQFSSYQTGVTYQFFHSLGLLAIGVLQRQHGDSVWLARAANLLVIGMLLFAGSIYALTAGAPRWFGMVAPLGGLSLMAGWLIFFVGVRKLP